MFWLFFGKMFLSFAFRDDDAKGKKKDKTRSKSKDAKASEGDKKGGKCILI
jgi:hypothetical protein